MGPHHRRINPSSSGRRRRLIDDLLRAAGELTPSSCGRLTTYLEGEADAEDTQADRRRAAEEDREVGRDRLRPRRPR